MTMRFKDTDAPTPNRLLGHAPALLFFGLLAVAPLFSGSYILYMAPQYLSYGILALSLGFLWGMGGMLSFCQGTFFAVGAYAMALIMPMDFALNSAYPAMLIGVAVCAVFAAVTGYLVLGAGVQPMYFVLVTLAISVVFERVATSWTDLTGGFGGKFIEKMSFGLVDDGMGASDIAFYYFTCISLLVLFAITTQLMRSRFGLILTGIRENEPRVTALGLNVRFYKVCAFVFASALAAFAGSIYGTSAGFVSPTLGGVIFSTSVIVWVAIGGRGSLLGAMIGGIAVASLTTVLVSKYPNYWQLFIGILFILVIMFFRRGVSGLFARGTS